MEYEKQIKILIMDNCTKKEAISFLKDGATIYEESEKESFFENYASCGFDEEEAVHDWDVMPEVVFEGVLYKIEYVL